MSEVKLGATTFSAVLLSACLGAGCASESQGSPTQSSLAGNCKIAGTYRVVGKQTGGTCPATGDQELTFSITTSGSKATIVYQGVNDSCPDNQIDGCKVTAVCRFVDKDGRQIGASQASYTFDSKGFSGSQADSVTAKVPLEDGGTIGPCTGNYDVTGIRQ